MIEVCNLTKKYGENIVINEVNFKVDDGTIVGLLGRNGAGKSTLLKSISGMIPFDYGKVFIDKIELQGNITKIHKNIGLLFGNDMGLYGNLTVQENLIFFSRLNGIDNQETEYRIKELSRQFNFSTYLNQKASTLSKGMMQKVVLARSVIHSPQNILLDEPESGLDFEEIKNIRRFILEQKELGKAVLFSSHSLSLINDISDIVYLLENKKVEEVRK